MKILHIIAGAAHGGAETFCLDAIKALHEKGVAQFVICRPHSVIIDALNARNIPYTPLSFHRILKFWQSRKIARVIAAQRPELVHCWMNRASSFVPNGVCVPVLGWFGGYYDLKNYQNCDYFMGVTKDIVRHIREHIPRPERAYLGHTFGTLEESPPVTRQDFDVPSDAKIVLLLSRMHQKKGIDTLLMAAQKMAAQHNTYFLLAGDGPDFEKYKAMAQEMGLQGYVRFLGWRNDRSSLLKIADVCTLPSRYEPFGTVIAEAWFAGVPLVATRADGARQYVTHERDGLLCDIDDVDGLAGNFIRALTDKDLRKTLIEGGQKSYAENFSKEVVTQELLRSYQDMIQKGK